jgi:serine/threonine-protein kinase
MWITTDLADGNLAGLQLPSADVLAKRLATHIREVAEGLDFLHSCGLIHGNVKPSNILLIGDHAKLADFDLVQATADSSGAANLIRYGDVDYLAPEVRFGKLCPASDQYSLARTYVTLRLRPPGSDLRDVRILPDLAMLPATEHAIVLRALANDPQERFRDCRGFADALVAAM